MKVIVLVAVLCAVAFAQVPTVQQSLASFDQNGGVLTVYGTGFIQRNLDQFTYNLVTGTALCPATNPCRFVCHYRTMVVNPAGTITYCEVPYIPDNTLGPAGSNYITLSVNNANGATVSAVTVATIRAVVSDITPSTSNPIPPAPFGITINGAGFPSENSLFTMSPTASAYKLDITDNTNPYTSIDLLASRTGVLTANPLSFWDYTNTVPLNKICRFTKTQVDCYYMEPAAKAFVVNNNINGVFATLTITQAFVTAVAYNAMTPEHTDRIGPVQIGIVQTPTAPSVTAVPVKAPYSPASFLSRSDQFLTISGANFLQYPVMNGNIFVPKLSGGNNYLRCDPVSVTTTTFTCGLTARPKIFAVDIGSMGALNADIGTNVPAALISGTVYVSKTLASTKDQAVAITNSAGATALLFKYPLNPATSLPDPSQSAIPQAIVPNDQPIQQDALTVSFSSTGSSFFVPDINYLYEYALKSSDPPAPGSASAPANIAPIVTLTNLNGIGGTVKCYSIFPDQVEPNTVPLAAIATKAGVIATANPQSAPNSMTSKDVCSIVSVTPSKITVKVPQTITSPVGTVVSASIDITSGKSDGTTNAFTGGAAENSIASVAIGIVAPGAGVGGDPHFFGFLGEKYEFAGEAGRVYNLLSDEGIQLNAEIGYWHWNRGKETIIRKLALKTNDHRVLIDAGGNNLGTEGFSISVDGASIAPSRIRQTYLGSEGWIRWYPLTADDKFRLPLWERHQGVALIDIFLNDYKFQVLAVEEGKDKDGVWHKQPSRFLDFMAEMLTDRRPHGLFGQSAHLRANQRSVKDFSIEGEGADYEVSNLFGDDFTFNKFSAK